MLSGSLVLHAIPICVIGFTVEFGSKTGPLPVLAAIGWEFSEFGSYVVFPGRHVKGVGGVVWSLLGIRRQRRDGASTQEGVEHVEDVASLN